MVKSTPQSSEAQAPGPHEDQLSTEDREMLGECFYSLGIAEEELGIAAKTLSEAEHTTGPRWGRVLGEVLSAKLQLAEHRASLEAIDRGRDVPRGKRLSEEQEYPCMDCRIENLGPARVEYYFVHDHVWREAVPDGRGFLCLSCLGDRLGRAVRWTDLGGSPQHTEVDQLETPELRRLLVERLWRTGMLERCAIGLPGLKPGQERALEGKVRSLIQQTLREVGAPESVAQSVMELPVAEKEGPLPTPYLFPLAAAGGDGAPGRDDEEEEEEEEESGWPKGKA